jgi:hypothetical protein
VGAEYKVVKVQLDLGTMETDLENVIDEGDGAGWSLVSITPVSSGSYGNTSHLLVTFTR